MSINYIWIVSLYLRVECFHVPVLSYIRRLPNQASAALTMGASGSMTFGASGGTSPIDSM